MLRYLILLMCIVGMYANVYKVQYENPYTRDKIVKQSFYITEPKHKTILEKVD